MAYLYRKNRSPFWYMHYLDADKVKHDKSTRLREDDPPGCASVEIHSGISIPAVSALATILHHIANAAPLFSLFTRHLREPIAPSWSST